MVTVVETRALTKRYGRHVAVQNIGLQVQRGSVFGLIGPNGAGKTTVLRMLVDIIRPTAGELSVLGETPRRAGAAMRRRIGYLPGDVNLTDRVSGRMFLQHIAQLSGVVAEHKIDQLAERLELDMTRPVRDLSKGNRQKLGLIQAFMHEPELLILDEPTSGLDPLMQREFLAMVREASSVGQTIVLSSHILSEIQHAADDVAVLAQGRLVAHGDVASLRLTSVARLGAVIADTDALTLHTRMQALEQLEDVHIHPTPDDRIHRLTATIRGDMDPVVKALATFQIRDLTVEEPDLEESIIDLYARTK
ncbi:ABC transporter ATP-binding protein [Enteractinococcus coprophilus]|uniref:ABC-2 type transport system ATP-binding protein n=1 Tax=Enteractinococcus coprophilus TaxID=1027633 RepID=A0A543APD6_9MICC|nr:ABC transporter ATP-binding protein [Enteractinococcus coprophilus]TQL74451.1 ABC-2 type transport system ATP-binding protein [Enteractinococcus coprophilus]